MLVPKAGVDEYHCTPRSENEVWLAGQFLAVLAVPVAQTMDLAAYDHFGLHALTLDAPHVLAATLGSDLVGH